MADKLPFTVDQFKSRYFTGVLQILKNADGTSPPAEFYTFYIEQAVKQLERELDVVFSPTQFEERKLYNPQDFQQYCWLSLNRAPLISVDEVSIAWPNSADEIITFPPEWITFTPGSVLGRVQIVPQGTILGSQLMSSGGLMFPMLYRQGRIIPDLFRVKYTAGFPVGQLPPDVQHAIGMMASIPIFDNMGDIIGGAGIASKSMSIPGISMSVSTTSSPSFAGFGARVSSYRKELDKLLPQLKQAYGRTFAFTVA